MGERKYGIVSASDVRIAHARGADMHTASHMMARTKYRPINSRSPMRLMPQNQWKGIGNALTGAIVGGVQQVQAQRAAKERQARADAAEMHPAGRSWGAPSNPLGALTPPADMPAADSYYQAPRAGMGQRAQPTVITAATEPDTEPEQEYYRPPGGMGAKVPASRLAKFGQGRGT